MTERDDLIARLEIGIPPGHASVWAPLLTEAELRWLAARALREAGATEAALRGALKVCHDFLVRAWLSDRRMWKRAEEFLASDAMKEAVGCAIIAEPGPALPADRKHRAMTIDDLIARCEAALKGSRELDGEIGLLVNPGAYLWAPESWYGGPNEFLRWPDPKPGVVRYGNLLHYTSSLDAAITLVPDGMYWSVSRNGCALVGTGRKWDMLYLAEKLPPELAFVIAALKARKAGAK